MSQTNIICDDVQTGQLKYPGFMDCQDERRLYLDKFLNVNVPIHGPDGSNQSCTPILVDVEVQKDSLVA